MDYKKIIHDWWKDLWKLKCPHCGGILDIDESISTINKTVYICRTCKKQVL